MTNNKFKILSLDGGGVRGYLSIKILENVEKHLNDKDGNEVPIGLRFDLIAGTSTGSIIAALLAKGMFAKEAREIYEKSMSKVFKKRSLLERLFQSKYCSQELKNIVFDTLKDSATQQQLVFNELERDLIITAFDLDEFKPKVFKSDYSKKNDKKFCVSDAIMASTAAPTYFPAYSDSKAGGVLIDGGMSANNPSLIALIDARHFDRKSKKNTLPPETLSDVCLLSIGTGDFKKKLDIRGLKNSPKWDWAINLAKRNSPVKEVLFTAQEEMEENKVRLLSETEGVFYKRINPKLNEYMELDDVQNMYKLDRFTSIEEHLSSLEKMLLGASK
ncbi:patatin-like phospholipase family protein [Sulfurimonas sp. HSL-1656]|uniref:patatin-like phospholipase family protein n=1 Tax=Thiomicrolovo subterrani TaxID=3131934 RepID=UPI0031F93163